MLFVLNCTDKLDHLNVRLDNRPAHLDYLKSQGSKVKLAGPFLGADHKTPIGSMVIIECASEDEAKTFAANDPYAKAGLFADVAVRPWIWAVNVPSA